MFLFTTNPTTVATADTINPRATARLLARQGRAHDRPEGRDNQRDRQPDHDDPEPVEPPRRARVPGEAIEAGSGSDSSPGRRCPQNKRGRQSAASNRA